VKVSEETIAESWVTLNWKETRLENVDKVVPDWASAQ